MRRNLKLLAIGAVAAAVLGGASTAAALVGQGPGAPKATVGGGGKTIVVTLTAPGAQAGFSDPGGVRAPVPPTGSPPPGPATAPAVRTCAGGATRIPCLPAAGAAPPPPPPPEAGAVIIAASRVTLQRELPEPHLVVQPGYAVTGLAAYLEIHTPDDLAFTFAGFRNAVFVTCNWTSFDVDWGDGSPAVDVTSVGGPYPDGDVTHVYQQAAAADDLHVTENWSCPWRDEIGGAGVVSLASDSHLPLEVREIQTVSD